VLGGSLDDLDSELEAVFEAPSTPAHFAPGGEPPKEDPDAPEHLLVELLDD
jgi:hypothetical protein